METKALVAVIVLHLVLDVGCWCVILDDRCKQGLFLPWDPYMSCIERLCHLANSSWVISQTGRKRQGRGMMLLLHHVLW